MEPSSPEFFQSESAAASVGEMTAFNQLLSQLRSAYGEARARIEMLEHELHVKRGCSEGPVECKPEVDIHGSAQEVVDPWSPINFLVSSESPVPQFPCWNLPSALLPAALSSQTVPSGNDTHGDPAGEGECADVEEALSKSEIGEVVAIQSQNVLPQWTRDGDPHQTGQFDGGSRNEDARNRGQTSVINYTVSTESLQSGKVWNFMLKPSSATSQVLSSKNDFTKHSVYELFMIFVIVLNAAYIGWTIQHALTSTDNANEPFIGPVIFLSIYVFDLAARLFFERVSFFRGTERYWNSFDTFVVLIMIVELVLGMYFEGHDVAALSVFRALRLVRFVKVVKYFIGFSREFRMLVHAIQRSVRAFSWLVVLLGFIVYFVAIVMTQGALGSCQHGGVLADADQVCELFGSLERAVLSLYLAVFGGIAWGELEVAAEALGLLFPFVIILYVSFMHMILLNTITGIILEIHRSIAETEKLTMISDTVQRKQDYIMKMQDAFDQIDINSNGGISSDEFQHALDDHRIVALLEALDVEIQDANHLFTMLDRDNSGAILIDEFIFGMMHMKGEAKAVDVLKLQIESDWMVQQIRSIRRSVDEICGKPHLPSSSLQTLGPSLSRDSLSSDANLHFRTSMLALGSTGLGAATLSIERTEERAVTLSDLQSIVFTIQQDCKAGSWKETGCAQQDAQLLRPQGVNLYHFNWHCICPATAPEGVELRGLDLPDSGTEGHRVVQMDARNVCLAEGISRGNAMAGVLSVSLVKGRFQTFEEAAGSCVSIEGLNLHAEAPGEIIVNQSLSYKEIINPMPTQAVWFCSHWWGEAVLDFVEACEAHARLRKMSDDAAYWVCAYANRQHDLQNDISCDPETSSFRRAMRAAKGVLLVLDSKATPFARIWCTFELYNTLSDDKPIDIVTIAGQGSNRGSQLLTQESLPGETVFTKTFREEGFPIDLLVSGMRRRLEDGEASHEADKIRILECMAGKQTQISQTSLTYRRSNTEADLGRALDRANGMLHSYLALAAWPQAVKNACVQDVDPQNPGQLRLPTVLKRARHLQHFNLSLAHLKELQNADLELLSQSFQDNLSSIHLCFEGCANITDAGLRSLVEELPANLQELSLDCVGCRRISDVGLQALAQNLPKGLKRLDLFFATCPLISVVGISALGEGIPIGLRHFQGRFEGTKVNCKFDSVKEVAKFVASVRRPRHKGTAGAMVARWTAHH